MTLPFYPTIPQVYAPDTLDDEGWRKKGECYKDPDVDPDLFIRQDQASIERAKAMCNGCEVRRQCLESALFVADHQFGTWGGKSEEELRRMRKEIELKERAHA